MLKESSMKENNESEGNAMNELFCKNANKTICELVWLNWFHLTFE